MKPDDTVFYGPDDEVRRESARRTRRSFLVGGATAAAAAGAAYWLDHTPAAGRLQAALRSTENFNASVARGVFAERGLAPTYPLEHARPLRLNGVIGLGDKLELSSWRLQLVGTRAPERSPLYARDVTAWEYKYPEAAPTQATGTDSKSAGTAKPKAASGLNPAGAKDSPAAAGIAARFEALARSQSRKRNVGSDEAGPSASSLDIGTPGLLLTMDDLLALPRVELVTEFKCVEGWSSVTHWAGVRLRDLLDAYPPALVDGHEPRFLYMETPGGDYYCGYDLAAARHPQTLLVTHMHGEPLAQEHGAPLRLHMPIKYGYKQLKRIGLIAYMDTKPDDYWTRLGYDWYAGL